ncbi:MULTISPECIES: tyrosine-type recombinase/integrase [Pseudomonas]|uniref:tyrosine-type recombinase/integrase n=1 Tax=Pseudomonas TaxID=286 RepID=UPI002362319B|nr:MULTISPECIES: site-specific integrase [Pseudomonas]WJV23205.1 site-specific integrase [Pseudomonas chlororaphis]
MRVIKVPGCCIARSTVTQHPILIDVFLIIDENGMPLWHENLFLIEIAKEFDANTCRAYASDLLSFARMSAPMGGWSFVNDSIMSGYFVGDLIQARGFNESSILRHVSSLKKFYKWLFDKGYLSTENKFNWKYKKYFVETLDNYSAFTASQHSHHSSYITTENYKKLLTNVYSNSPFLSARDKICIQLGYLSGTRACETLRIKASILLASIEHAKKKNKGIWATATYNLVGKRNKLRPLEIPPGLCNEISEFIRRFPNTFASTDCPLICRESGEPLLNEKHASYAFSKAHKLSDLTRKGHQGYHALRKSFATNLVKTCHEYGVDPYVVVPRRMGHDNIETTMGYIFFEALLSNRSKILRDMRMMHFKGLKHA